MISCCRHVTQQKPTYTEYMAAVVEAVFISERDKSRRIGQSGDGKASRSWVEQKE